mgnify:CR=1 FL=1
MAYFNGKPGRWITTDTGRHVFIEDGQTIEEALKEKLSTKVSIVAKENGAGKIEVEFFSHEELDRLMDVIMH